MTNTKNYQRPDLICIRLGAQTVFMSSSGFSSQALGVDNVDASNDWSEN